jgi:hypothetical protein
MVSLIQSRLRLDNKSFNNLVCFTIVGLHTHTAVAHFESEMSNGDGGSEKACSGNDEPVEMSSDFVKSMEGCPVAKLNSGID